jgi:CheY-like chemotaxis protein
MADILIIEDDPVFGELLAMHLEDQGHQPCLAHSLAQAREQLGRGAPDAVLLDHQLPDGFGSELLKQVAGESGAPPVIMITEVSDNTLAIQAMGAGAYDFIRKPMDEVELDATLGNALRSHRLTRQVTAITESQDYRVDLDQIVGASPAILAVCKTIGAVATRNAPVLITGESGTGKEVVARAIHHHSGRRGLFLPVNCSALDAEAREQRPSPRCAWSAWIRWRRRTCGRSCPTSAGTRARPARSWASHGWRWSARSSSMGWPPDERTLAQSFCTVLGGSRVAPCAIHPDVRACHNSRWP